MGTVAIRIPAIDELTHRSPSEMRMNGTMQPRRTTNTSMVRLCDPRPRSEPRFQATGSRAAAPNAIRAHATPTGGTSVSASLMKK